MVPSSSIAACFAINKEMVLFIKYFVSEAGMCICIEPMVNLGSRNIVIERDGWTCS